MKIDPATIRSVTFVLSVLVLSIIVFPVAAQIQSVPGGDFGIAQGESVEEATTLVTDIINVFLGLVALIAAIFLIIGGVRYITSQGDEQQTEKAKKTILYAVIGLVVIGLAALIVNFVVDAIGGTNGGGGGNFVPPPPPL